LNISGGEITVHVHMYGILADYAGIKNMDIQIPEKTTISGFLKFIIKEEPDIFKKEFMDPESGNSIVKVFRNGELMIFDSFLQFPGDKNVRIIRRFLRTLKNLPVLGEGEV
jgi:hypothetical protein